MKHKAPLALMELLIMLLVFALAAGLCLQAFSTAKQVSLENTRRDCAVLQAQNAAELLKYYHGDFSAAAEHYGGSYDGSGWSIYYDENWQMVPEQNSYLLLVEPQESGTASLGQAALTVHDRDGQLLFSLSFAWQEVAE